jgi:hypothetical protein
MELDTRHQEGTSVAKGKYAARAASARVSGAQETVERLRQQLAEERAAAAHEIASLKTENQRLAGKLTSAVKSMASAEVERVQRQAADAVAAARQDAMGEVRIEREAARERAFAALKVIRDYVHTLPVQAWPQLYDALGVTADEVYAAGAEVSDLDHQSRRARRMRQKDFRANGNDMESVFSKSVLGDMIAGKLTAGED